MGIILKGNIIDLLKERIYKGTLRIENGLVSDIIEENCKEEEFILPGFIDAHVHIESSMLVPSEFARLAVVHGTVATVSDPHEIGNVLGLEGVEFMLKNGSTVPFKFFFGAPSCVPATRFETAGATISTEEIEELFKRPSIKYLAEMMNWPGVLYDDPEVYKKISVAKKYQKLIDGHAPGLRGEQVLKYAQAGITTDHECFTKEEAIDKLANGMKILIREGSAAKNFDALIDLLEEHEDEMMFCSDDKHPDNLVEGHINELVKRAISKNIPLFKVLKAACLNPIKHYGLEVGLLQKGDPADLIVVDNLKEFNILQTYIAGTLVAERGRTKVARSNISPLNRFNTNTKRVDDFKVLSNGGCIKVIEAIDGQLITQSIEVNARILNGEVLVDSQNDILKITVVNRYFNASPAVAFIKGFGIKEGALASSIAHDSHNIVAVGVDDDSLTKAVNEVIKNKGGIAAVHQNNVYSLALPVAGLMSGEDGYSVAKRYTELDNVSKAMGSPLSSPFMTLSFMALLVIPSLKLSDLGLFDGEKFKFVT